MPDFLNTDGWSEEKGFIDVRGPRCAACGYIFHAPASAAWADVACLLCGRVQQCRILNTPMGPAWSTLIHVEKESEL